MIPKFNQTMLPLLKTISDWNEYSLTNVVENLHRVFNLTEEEKNRKSTSINQAWDFYNKVWWWKSYLKQAWLVSYPKRWYFKITEEWKKVLNENLKEITVKYLKKYPSFVKFSTPSKKDKSVKNNINESDSIEELSPTELIETWFKNINNSLKNNLLEQLKETNPYYFEKIILLLFKEMWYWDFEETPKSWDGWIDGIIHQDQLWIERIYTQAKRYTTLNVWERDIRNFIWAMSWDVNKWIFVTTSDFDKKAKEKAKDAKLHKIILINWEKLTELMIKFNVWVQVKNTYKIKEIDWDFFNED